MKGRIGGKTNRQLEKYTKAITKSWSRIVWRKVHVIAWDGTHLNNKVGWLRFMTYQAKADFLHTVKLFQILQSNTNNHI